MQKSEIHWTDVTWNPIRGCTAVSPGCGHCYAAQLAARFSGPGLPYEGLATMDGNGRAHWTGEVRLVPEKLAEPLSRKSPAMIFVNSMSDLFHEAVPDEFIDRVFAVMAAADRHTFQVLTKRADRMAAYVESRSTRHWDHGKHPLFEAARGPGGVLRGHGADLMNAAAVLMWPLPNVWLGVSAEDQTTAEARIPLLLSIDAAVRFLSLEPMLAWVDLKKLWLPDRTGRWDALTGRLTCEARTLEGEPFWVETADPIRRPLDWVIVGGESGPGARRFEPDWARTLRDDCTGEGVPFFFKQWGGVRKVRTGRTLDGRTWDQMPALFERMAEHAP